MNFSKEVLRPCSLSGFRKNKQTKKKVGRKIQKKKSSAYTWFPNSTAATNGQKAKQGAETGREKQPALYAGVQWGRQETEAPGGAAPWSSEGRGLLLQGSLNVLGLSRSQGSSAAPGSSWVCLLRTCHWHCPCAGAPGAVFLGLQAASGREGGDKWGQRTDELSGPSGCADGTSGSG